MTMTHQLCASPGCTRALHRDNTSGYCHTHRVNVRRDVRTAAVKPPPAAPSHPDRIKVRVAVPSTHSGTDTAVMVTMPRAPWERSA